MLSNFYSNWLLGVFYVINLFANVSSVSESKIEELYIVNKFAPPNIELFHLAVDETFGYTYVGGKNRLYQLDKSLENVVANVTVGPELDSNICLPNKPCDSNKELTDNKNKLLLIDKGKKRLIACGSIFQGVCVARNLSNISQTLSRLSDPFEESDIISSNIEGGSIVGLISEGPTVNNSVLYIAATLYPAFQYTLLSHEQSITTRSLQYDASQENPIFHFAIQYKEAANYEGSVLKNLNEKGQHSCFKYVFESGGRDGHVYFVFTRTKTTENDENVFYPFIVARICKADQFYFSYVEMPIYCGESQKEKKKIQAAYYMPDSTGDHGTLFISFLSDGPIESTICSFRKDELDARFNAAVFACYKNFGKDSEQNEIVTSLKEKTNLCKNGGKPLVPEGRSMDSLGVGPIIPSSSQLLPKGYEPVNVQLWCGAFYLPTPLTATVPMDGDILYSQNEVEFTAITIDKLFDTLIAYIGTKTGNITQVNLNKSLAYNTIPLRSEVLSDFIWDQDKSLLVPQLYVTTKAQILRIRVAACEKFSTCDACLRSRDPYCGWCVLESRCSTLKECRSFHGDQLRWLTPNSTQCISIVPPQPVNAKLSADELSLTINPLPSLQATERYECVYNNVHFYNATMNRINSTAAFVACNRPAGSTLSPTRDGEDYQNVTLSVRYNGVVDIASTTIIYYDCSVYGRRMEKHRPCAACLSSRWSCSWCVERGECISEFDRRCTRNSNECPTVVEVKPESKLIPVNTMRSITLMTRNVPTNGVLKCLVQLENTKISVNAQISNARVTCHVQKYNYAQNEQSLESNVVLQWRDSFVVDSASEESSTVTFYKCDAMRTDCSVCVSADTMYKCGWCKEKSICSVQDFCNSTKNQPLTWFTDGSNCPPFELKRFEPTSGPINGGTELSIIGVNMGRNVDEIDSVILGGVQCRILHQKYQISVRVVCETGKSNSAGSVPVKITINGVSKTFPEQFHYRDPIVSEVLPIHGVQAGGTLLSIKGSNLDTGGNITISLKGSSLPAPLPCIIQKIAPNEIKCRTSPSDLAVSRVDVVVSFDGFIGERQNAFFSYYENPEVNSVWTLTPQRLTSFLFGGRNITVEGNNFDIVQKSQISVMLERNSQRRRKRSVGLTEDVFIRHYNRSCDVIGIHTMRCYSPKISDVQGDNLTSWNASFQFIMDSVVISRSEKLQYFSNPTFEKWSAPKPIKPLQLLPIKAFNMGPAISKDEIEVMIQDHDCPVLSVVREEITEIKCTVPDIPGVSDDKEFLVTLGISNNTENYEIGYLLYDVETPPLSDEVIVVLVVVGVILIALVGGVIVYCYSKNRNLKANKNNFQLAMENMEKSVRNDFRKAFAELNVEMTDLTADIDDYGIPCLDYRTYVTNLFFPSFKYHPCTKAPDQNVASSNMDNGLQQFLLLLSNRNFLSTFIHTLEEQKSFSNRDKGNVASLLTVALHHKLDYFTEIMKSLVKDLISVSVQRNAKLILRRSDSVAERMLSNWMYICLYPYLRDKAGSPIFLLLKAIKQQVSKGAVDAVTGKARYTLSDDRLLQGDIESETLTLFVATGSDADDEPVIVKVLTCDSIAQVKEKVMDAVYKRMPFSQRPKADQLDIEWRHGQSGHLVLPSQDYTAEPNSRWRRLMTISDYKLPNNATLALLEKQLEHNGSQDMSSIVSNHGADSNPLAPMLSDEFKIFHLGKYSDDIDGKRESTINRDRQKHIPEIYLLRLINMKGILQNYVDDVFQAILDKASIPSPVKHFFHFLDELALKHGTTDAEILHIWKTNSLFARFWVTILKNPDSVFDIEKPDTIASTMAVISQTFIDACSVSEHKPTKDSPINKQLYAKEIPTYKKLVQEYYEVVKEQPPVSDQDVNACIAQISREHKCEFDVNVALKELWGYLIKYYEEVNESLENDENIPTSIKQKLQQIYNLIDAA